MDGSGDDEVDEGGWRWVWVGGVGKFAGDGGSGDGGEGVEQWRVGEVGELGGGERGELQRRKR